MDKKENIRKTLISTVSKILICFGILNVGLTGIQINTAQAQTDITVTEPMMKLTPTSSSAVFSPDGNMVLLGTCFGFATLLDINTGEEIQRFYGHGGPSFDSSTGTCIKVAYSPNGDCIATGANDDRVILWDPETADILVMLEGHTGNIFDLAFSPNGSQIASSSADGSVKIWDINSGNEIGTFIVDDTWAVSVSFSPDGRWLLTGQEEGYESPGTRKSILWDIDRIERLYEYPGPSTAVAFSSDGNLIALGGSQSIKVYETEPFDARRKIPKLYKTSSHIMALTFSPDDKMLLAGGPGGGIDLRLYNVETTELIRIFKAEDHYWDMALSPDGSKIVNVGPSINVEIWDISDLLTSAVKNFTLFE